MDFDAIAKIVGVLGGAGIFGAAAAWLSHFFASGDTRVSDRRKDKDEQQRRIDGLEETVRMMGRNAVFSSRVRNLQSAEINRLSWAYDRMRDVLLAMAEIVIRCEPGQTYIVNQANSFPIAETILEDAERIFIEANPIEENQNE